MFIEVPLFSETSPVLKNSPDLPDNHENDENISFLFLKKIRSKHPKNLFFGQLNVNSIRNKFESVQEIVQNTFDIFLVCETKIDSSFPNQQFCIPEYRIFRNDRNACGGGLLFYVNQDLNCKVLNKYQRVRILRF